MSMHVAIFAANVDVAACAADRASRDHHSFDQLVRVHFHQRAVLAGARLAFVAIRQNVFRLAGVFGNETPLHSRRKARAAAPAQIRFLHFVDDLLGRHLLERFFERLVAVVLQVDVDRLCEFGNAEAPADDRHFGRMRSCTRRRTSRHWLRLLAVLQLLEDRVHFVRIEILVEIVIHLHRRARRCRRPCTPLLRAKMFRSAILPCCRCPAASGRARRARCRRAACRKFRAHLNVIAPGGLAAQHRVIRERFGHLQYSGPAACAISSSTSSLR